MGARTSEVRTPLGRAEQGLVIHQSSGGSLTLGWSNQRVEDSGCNSTYRLRFELFRRTESLSISCPESLPSTVRLGNGCQSRMINATKEPGGLQFLDDLSQICHGSTLQLMAREEENTGRSAVTTTHSIFRSSRWAKSVVSSKARRASQANGLSTPQFALQFKRLAK